MLRLKKTFTARNAVSEVLVQGLRYEVITHYRRYDPTTMFLCTGVGVHRHLNAFGTDGQATQHKAKGLSIEGMLETSF